MRVSRPVTLLTKNGRVLGHLGIVDMDKTCDTEE